MLVRELMTRPAVTVTPHTPAREALRRLAERDVTAMPVVDDSGALVGVVSEADLIGDLVVPDQRAHEIPVHLGVGPAPQQVGDVMSHFPLSVRADADLAVAVELMTGSAAKSLPVLEDGLVVGVVSRRDVVSVLARGDDRIEADVEELLGAAGLSCGVRVSDGVVILDGLDDLRQRQLATVLATTVRGVVGLRFTGSADRHV